MNKKKLKYAALVLLAIAIIVFLIQNADVVEVHLLFWPIQIPRSLLILVSMGIGALSTFIFMMLKKDKAAKPYTPPAEDANAEIEE